ncbi:MAG: histone-like nucleoid-structuring protein, MvaT/MvaU family [Pseudomonadales bacterium]|jgi:hypothetical protein|nr:histone-like nucleoid-structuring protein, MvaT/MvaU family [Pseudomonadales bacterium]
MDKLVELKTKQAALAELQKEVEALEKSKEIQKELAFKEDLEKLLKKYGKTMNDIVRAAGGRSARAAGTGRKRAKRKLKIYLNPHTKEKVETRGGNHRILKAWKAEYGADKVESWLQN